MPAGQTALTEQRDATGRNALAERATPAGLIPPTVRDDTTARSMAAASEPGLPPLLAFGAHPDDLEFGCGGVLAGETRRGRAVHLVVCSRGESATHGTPTERYAEAAAAAKILGATLEFLELDGDAHLETRVAHAIKIAAIIRRVRPAIVLAPTLEENQHPDHARLGRLVRDAARLARYGGFAELKGTPPHSIMRLLFYAITPDAEPSGTVPLLVDVSDSRTVAIWTRAMEAHATQTRAREYVELALARARVRGLGAGLSHAIALFPADSIVVESLSQLSRSARRF